MQKFISCIMAVMCCFLCGGCGLATMSISDIGKYYEAPDLKNKQPVVEAYTDEKESKLYFCYLAKANDKPAGKRWVTFKVDELIKLEETMQKHKAQELTHKKKDQELPAIPVITEEQNQNTKRVIIDVTALDIENNDSNEKAVPATPAIPEPQKKVTEEELVAEKIEPITISGNSYIYDTKTPDTNINNLHRLEIFHKTSKKAKISEESPAGLYLFQFPSTKEREIEEWNNTIIWQRNSPDHRQVIIAISGQQRENGMRYVRMGLKPVTYTFDIITCPIQWGMVFYALSKWH